MKSKGFTLIELLVVVAIIGILATVVLASLGDARQRANDAAITAAVSQARSEIEIFYLDNNTYAGADNASTDTPPGVLSAFEGSIIDNGGSSAYFGNATDYIFAAALNETGDFFCVDESGYAGEGNLTALPTAVADCS